MAPPPNMADASTCVLALMRAGVPNAEFLRVMDDLPALRACAERHGVDLPPPSPTPPTSCAPGGAPLAAMAAEGRRHAQGFVKFSPPPKVIEEAHRQQQAHEPRTRGHRWRYRMWTQPSDSMACIAHNSVRARAHVCANQTRRPRPDYA